MNRQPDRPNEVPSNERRLIETEIISAPVRVEIARKWKALLKSQGTTIGFTLHKLIDMDFAQAGEAPPPELASELARFDPKGRRPYKRHVPLREPD